MADDRRSGLAALIGALILSVASLGFVLWFAAQSWASHPLFIATSADAPEPSADIASPTRTAP